MDGWMDGWMEEASDRPVLYEARLGARPHSVYAYSKVK
jgi:hypothetical protein